MEDSEKLFATIYDNATQEEIREEIDRLGRLYYQRMAEFKKASRIRWLLSFVGFVLVIFYIFTKGDIKALFCTDIRTILTMFLASIVMTGFCYLVNVSIFGWLFQKDIAEGRRLDDIAKRIKVLEKLLDK